MYRMLMSVILIAAGSIAPAGGCRAQHLRLRAGVGRAREGAGGRQGRDLRRDDGAAGSAPHRGAPEPDRAGALGRPRRVHGRRAGGRLAAARADPVGQPEDTGGPAGIFRSGALRDACWRCRGELDRAQGDVHPAGNPHVHLDPRNIARVAAALAERMAELDPGEAAHYRARAKAFLRALAGGDGALGEDGCAAQGHAGRRLPSRTDLPHQLARHARGRLARAQAGPAAVRIAPERAAARLSRASRRRRSCAPPTTIRARPNGCPSARRFRSSPSPSRSAATRRRRICSGFSTTRWRACWLQPNEPRGHRSGHPGPAFAAGLLVTATHVPLGIQVLNRGIVFIDLAIAQIAGLGVILADCIGLEPQGWARAGGALVAAFAGALLAHVDRKTLARRAGSHHRHLFSSSRRAARCCSSRPTPTAASTSRNCWSARFCG